MSKIVFLLLQIIVLLWLAFMVASIIFLLTWGAWQVFTQLPF